MTHEPDLLLSVIIPTLNEAQYLPGLLDALGGQTRPPVEIIVADAGSHDDTAAIAAQRGARIVSGGRPARGRNAGAAAACGDLLLFLDADVLPGPEFVEELLHTFIRRDLDVATCLVQALNGRKLDDILHETTNFYLIATQAVIPHAPGFAILIRRDLHDAIEGFDETLLMAEDHDYVSRASKLGRFGVMDDVRLPVSVRRLQKEGTVALVAKYLWVEAHYVAGRPVYSLPFAYDFGEHRLAADARRSKWLAQVTHFFHKARFMWSEMV